MGWKTHIWFASRAVTIIVCVVYVATIAGLLYVNHVLPTAPLQEGKYRGVNVSEAWLDLENLSKYRHPYNSARNDNVRNWLLRRIYGILADNDVKYSTEGSNTAKQHDSSFKKDPLPVVLFNDVVSNVTYSTSPGLSVYFEGTNIIVYIRGERDDDWWVNDDTPNQGLSRGVLVNAHYDSVSTSFGTTDDGVGVVTVLQLIRYFTTKGNEPHRGVVALFNNGEEDFLNGANAFAQHPISKFPNSFLNLEGAGAGGRASCFRSTDTDVMRSYKRSPHPFGNALSADGFKRGLIRSETDYAVFTKTLGLRGLDVAFMEPRSRYHTHEDSTQFTSRDSVWHMLSAAVETMKGLTSEHSSTFDGKGEEPVYFDMFGKALGLLGIRAMFSLTISLLVLTPLVLVGMVALLRRQDKLYLFARRRSTNSQDPHSPDDEMIIQLRGWRGLARFPVAFLIASTATLAFAFIIAKVNPFISYSSPYAVWSMLFAAWICVAWFFLKGSDIMRPTALHRAHCLGWISVVFWLLLVIAAIGEGNYSMGSFYPIVIAQAAIFTATLIAYLEMFALPRISDFVEAAGQAAAQEPADSAPHSARRAADLLARDPGSSRPGSSRREDDSEATETTSLIRKVTSRNRTRSGGTSAEHRHDGDASSDGFTSTNHVPGMPIPYRDEQGWSGCLPSWLWIVEFLITGPIIIILFGQLGLFLSSSLPQTAADGSPVWTVYTGMAVVTIFIMIPVSPYLHRFTSTVPLFLLLVFIGTLIYNLTAFPFSDQSQLKIFFQQKLDLDTGVNTATLLGVDGYIQRALTDIPSAAGQDVQCTTPTLPSRKELRECAWTSLEPHPIPLPPPTNTTRKTPLPEPGYYKYWISVNTTRVDMSNEAEIYIRGQNTRNCKLLFSAPLSDFDVDGAASSDVLQKLPAEGGVKEIRLWSREWERTWRVNVKWPADTSSNKKNGTIGLDGRVVCMWADVNQRGVLPAFDEVEHFLPRWATVSKLADGLLEGSRAFMI